MEPGKVRAQQAVDLVEAAANDDLAIRLCRQSKDSAIRWREETRVYLGVPLRTERVRRTEERGA